MMANTSATSVSSGAAVRKENACRTSAAGETELTSGPDMTGAGSTTDGASAFIELLQGVSGSPPMDAGTGTATDTDGTVVAPDIAAVTAPPAAAEAISAQLLSMLGLPVVEPARPTPATLAATGIDDGAASDVMQCIVEGPAKFGSGGAAKVYSANPALLERLARDLERTATATPSAFAASQPEVPAQMNTTAHDHRHSVDGAAPAPAPLQDMLALSKAAADFAPRALDAGVGSKAWQEQLGNQLSWMIDRGEQLATLRLSPDHLGPLEVRIAVRESEATVWFAATQPETRAALELAMPRLRDMLATQGIALLQSSVSNGSPRQPQPQEQHPGTATRGSASERVDSGAVANVRGATLGLVDLYA